MASINGSTDAFGYSPSTKDLQPEQQKQQSPRLSATTLTASDRGRRSEVMSNQITIGGSSFRPSQLEVNRVPSTSASPRITGRESSISNFGFGESKALAIPGSNRSKNQLSSPAFSATSASPLLSATSAPFQFAASTSQNTSAGLSRFNLASSSNQSLHALGISQAGGRGSIVDSLAGSGGSSHSRHSSGYASSLGGNAAGGGGSGSGNGNGGRSSIDYSTGLYGSTTSTSAGQNGTSFGTEGLRSISGKANVSVGSLTSAFARSNLSDQAAIQMAATSSYGSSGAASAQSHARVESPSLLIRPVTFRQSFSEESPDVVDHASSAVSHGSSASNNNVQAPASLASTGLSTAPDPRTQLGITNLPYRVRWQDLKDLFRKAGTVLRADVSLTPDNRSRGYGTVLMASEDDAIRACDMFRGFNWQGRTLDVLIDRSGTLLLPDDPAPMASSLSVQLDMTARRSSESAPLPQHILAQQAGQLPSGISPALIPFMGGSNRASIAAPSSHQQGGSASWPGQGFPSQQRASSISAGVPFFNPNGAAMTGNMSANMPLSFTHQHPSSHGQGTIFQSGHIPQQQIFQQQYQQQMSYVPPFAGAPFGSMQQPYGNSPASIQSGMMTNPYMNLNPGAPMLVPPSLPQAPQANSYYGRVLFVGNLPFHCQWQDLKDLFRSAGSIQRADVALSAEGKSRGFGTVLFASAEDAQNAVRIYHGYEYSGRTLKVHFDRFAQTTSPPPGTLPATASQYTMAFAAANTPTNVSSSSAAQTQHHQQSQGQQQQTQQQQQNHQQQIQQNGLIQQQMQQYRLSSDASLPPSSTAAANNGSLSFSAFGNAQNHGTNDLHYNGAPSISHIQQLPTSTHGQGREAVADRAESSKPSNIRPGRITLPPQGFPGSIQSHQSMSQFSPTVPMTPGMPGFTFHAIPQTPPAYHHFLSPGLNGPFSPLLGSPQMGPATPGAGSGAFNPHLNHAPGAPIHFSNGMTTPISNVLAGLPSGFNPMFPPMGITFPTSSGPSQPQHQYGLPQTPHWSQPRQSQNRQKKQEPLPELPGKFEDKAEVALQEEKKPEDTTTSSVDIGSSEVKDDEDGYPFPVVSPFGSALSQRRASTNSPAVTPMLGPNSSAPPKSPGWERRGSLALNMSSLSTDEASTSTSRLSLRRLLASADTASERLQRETKVPRASLGEALELKKNGADEAAE